MNDTISGRLESIFRSAINNEREVEVLLSGADFESALSLDSIAFLELMLEIEQEFGFSFDFQALGTALKDYPSLLAHVHSRATR